MSDTAFLTAGAAIATAIFIFDLYVPFGIAAGTLYVSLILLSYLSPRNQYVLVMGILGAILTVIGALIPFPTPDLYFYGIMNRSISLFAILVTTVAMLKYKKGKLDLEKAHDHLAAVNRELEAFAYSVSHDLRAPLRGIDGFSHALEEDYGGRLDDEGKSHIRRIRSACQKMGTLIDELLELSRVTRRELRREKVDLSEHAREIAEELQKTQPQRKVDWSIENGLTAHGDGDLLRVALVNLLGNAWKFTGKADTARIEFGAERINGKTAFFVRDNGAGFDMEYAQKLFGAFQRLHTQGEFEGIGVGLATVQRVVNRHGGKVWGEGAVGKGATFHFTLN